MRIITLIAVIFLIGSCTTEDNSNVASYRIPDGFDLEIISMEPDVHAPVNIDFDEEGRMWIVEMTSYMPNIEGTGENSNTNKIKILEDTNGDGKMDTAKIFLDKLTLPRSVLLAYGGLIYSEPPYLWHIEIKDDKPGKRTLIDSTYASDGNVEHMPAALTMNIDNWIYSSGSNVRYKRKNGAWIKSFTTPRGQWGLTRDNYGRLYYNNNSNLLFADRIIPNALFKNEFLKLTYNNNINACTDLTVYPIQATAVNRGYQDGVLLENGYLNKTTSACSPLFYRNTDIPAWENSAFVCLPEINAIKKLDVNYESGSVSASFEAGSEYLISTDEGFRPVDLKTGPDGSIYIADMHRGIIQHKAYMTSYLREKILKRKLDTIMGMGRILKLSPNKNKDLKLSFDVTAQPLNMLYGDNAFLRDRAQHHIVYNALTQYIDPLKSNLKEETSELKLLHSLWTLEGLSAADENTILDLLDVVSARPFMQLKYSAMFMLSQMNIKQEDRLKKTLSEYLEKQHKDYDFLAISFLGDYSFYSTTEKERIYKSVLNRNAKDPLLIEAILANLKTDQGVQAAQDFINEGDSELWDEALAKVAERRRENKAVYYYNANLDFEDRRTVGMSLYRTHCASCHGVDGEGIKNLAPSLIDSEFVSGPEDRLILLTLHGMSGPIHLNGKEYNFNGEMAGVNNNEDLGDEEVKDILHFVRNAFASADYSIQEDRIAELRNRKPSGGGAFTEASLDSLVTLLKH